VDAGDVWVPGQKRVNVEESFGGQAPRSAHHLERRQRCGCRGMDPVRSRDNVGSATSPPARLVEHGGGRPASGRVAEINPQDRAPLALGKLAQKFRWIWPLFDRPAHWASRAITWMSASGSPSM